MDKATFQRDLFDSGMIRFLPMTILENRNKTEENIINLVLIKKRRIIQNYIKRKYKIFKKMKNKMEIVT